MCPDPRNEMPTVKELDDLLLDAKFSIPQPRAGAVSRAELIEVACASEARVVGVTAPAGYGKSTFLAEWATADDRRVACVTLDRFDDDPAVLLGLLASAYARVSPESTDLAPDMGSRGVSVLGRAAPRLASALRSSPVPFVLMVDNLDELRSSAAHDVLGVVISGIPRGSQLVAASRTEQPHLSRLRVSGDTLEFVASDLALDAAGAEQVFAQQHVDVTPDEAAAVTERTEGWPVGLYLSAVIARDNGHALNVSGDDPFVADYLYREQLSQLPEQSQAVLATHGAARSALCVAVQRGPR